MKFFAISDRYVIFHVPNLSEFKKHLPTLARHFKESNIFGKKMKLVSLHKFPKKRNLTFYSKVRRVGIIVTESTCCQNI